MIRLLISWTPAFSNAWKNAPRPFEGDFVNE
jgi:hypothetical protein